MRKLASFHGLSLFSLIGLGFLTLFFRGQIPLWRSLLLRYAALIGLLFFLKLLSDRTGKGKWGPFLYHFSPILFIILIYDSLGDLIQYLGSDIDPWLIRMDLLMFGVHPTVWIERWIEPWLTDGMSLAYASYYFIPLTLVVVLYAKGRMAEFSLSVFVLTFGYYVSFIG